MYSCKLCLEVVQPKRTRSYMSWGRVLAGSKDEEECEIDKGYNIVIDLQIREDAEVGPFFILYLQTNQITLLSVFISKKIFSNL